jgi:hypothetical protein
MNKICRYSDIATIFVLLVFKRIHFTRANFVEYINLQNVSFINIKTFFAFYLLLISMANFHSVFLIKLSSLGALIILRDLKKLKRLH